MNFAGKTVLVTGGAMGIGAATVRRLVQEGASAIIADRDAEAAAELIAALEGPGSAQQVLVDLSEPKSIRAMADEVSSIAPALHGLVNNAGIVIPASIEATDDRVWQQQMAINLHAPLLCAQQLLPVLRAGQGHVVNLTSEAAYRPRADNVAYDASKAGLSAMTRAMAVEFAPHGMRVNSVAPGWTVTEMHTGRGEDATKRRNHLQKLEVDLNILGRLALPEEIAAAIVFLLSEDASFITGSTLHVDGGRVAN